MSEEKKKFDFKKLAARKKDTSPKTVQEPKKRVVYQEVEKVPAEAVSPKTKKAPKPKVGRKSWKKKEVKYVRMAFDTPAATKQKVKQLLAGKFYEKYISQDEMINVALEEFIKKHHKG